MKYDAVIPIYEKDRECVVPTNTWMLPFVTPGVRTDTPTAIDPSVAPILTTVDVGVCWWWRWKTLRLQLFDLGFAFGNQDVDLTRYVAPWTEFGPNTEVDTHNLLSKPESYQFRGTKEVVLNYPGPPPFTDTLYITAKVDIFPPRGTTYGDEVGEANVVADAYQIQEGIRPNVCGCVPIVIITISLALDAGVEVTNVLTNYGPDDEAFAAEFGGEYGGVPGTVVNPFNITLNNKTNGTSVFLTGTAFAAKILPVAWYPWNGTWDDETGERL